MNEIWRKIEGFEKYEVSNLGRVRSLDYKHTGETKVLRPILNRYGYLRINLYKNSKLCSRSIHRLVAQAFILNPENKQQVNHIDANKQNNIVSNLEWCTNLENMQHARDMGLLKLTDEQKKKRSEKQKGKNHPFYGKHHTEETKRKLSEMRKGGKNPLSKRVRCIATDEIFGSVAEAAVKYNGDKTGIAKCCRGKLNTSGKHPVTGEKLVWRYTE